MRNLANEPVRSYSKADQLTNNHQKPTRHAISNLSAKEDKRLKRNGVNSMARTNGEYRSCPICSKRFYTSISRNKIYCGKACVCKSMSDNPRNNFIGSASNKGEKNGQYKHGKYAGKERSGGSSLKKKVRETVKSLEGNWCLFCGKPGPGLHLHRVLYGSEGGVYEVDNCVQLCNVDHALVHSNKKKWQPFLIQYLQSRLVPESREWVQVQHVRLRAAAPLQNFLDFRAKITG